MPANRMVEESGISRLSGFAARSGQEPACSHYYRHLMWAKTEPGLVVKVGNLPQILEAEDISARADVASLRIDVLSLQQAVNELTQQVSSLRVAARDATRIADLPEIIRLTRRLFPGLITIDEFSEPEFPSESGIVLNVQFAGTITEMLQMECEWIREIADLVGDFSRIRLSITRDGPQ